jgi:DNA excision repair protein ERCC-3
LQLTDRGTVKQELLKLGWPVRDDVPLVDGDPLAVELRDQTASGRSFVIRDYQKGAAAALVGNRGPGTGFGTIVLPCGAGKTIVGMIILSQLKTSTLIVTTNVSAVHQWIAELLDKTTLTGDQVAEYTGESKTIKPVTVATYQILTWRPEKDGPYPHFSIFRERSWGLIIYDEVHMLPAPVFRVAAELQAVRRVGLTATLVREDGCEGNVFSLVGPKRYDIPWKDLEQIGWIATAECIEIRLELPADISVAYAVADQRKKYRIASENPLKENVVRELVRKFPQDKILVIGQYLEQLDKLAHLLGAPVITGKTPNEERDSLYRGFREGKTPVLVVSKVANFAIDLPDASMAIQVSGSFGSRQEEAQRLGRILRPKERTSHFFTLITSNTVEEDFGANRQKFLAEQGYAYRIIRYHDNTDFAELSDTVARGACIDDCR